MRLAQLTIILASTFPVQHLAASAAWITVGGKGRLDWQMAQVHAIGLDVEQPTGLTLEPHDGLTFSAPQHAFRAFTGGEASLDPVLVVHTAETVHNITRLRAIPSTPDLELVDDQDNAWFRIEYAHLHLDLGRGDLTAAQADLVLTPFAAGQAGSQAHRGLLAAVVDLHWPIAPQQDPPVALMPLGSCEARFGPEIDLELYALNSISQLAHEPGGRVAFAPSASLRNVGSYDIRWYWAIAPHWVNGPNIGPHPFLAMHYYRELNGVFRQIGRSDVKHAWNTVNDVCPCPGGQVMYVGCSDIYGVGNNGNARFFGPREEVTAHTGEWTSLGSHFDGETVDDVRDHGMEPDTDHDEFQHRLTVWEDDLQPPGATFHVEAWYIAAGDTNIFNSMAHRRTTQAFTNNAWAFRFDEPTTRPGPALNAWVDPNNPGPLARNRRIETPEGRLQLAVQVTTNANSLTHYEYAVMNLDYDRQIEQFEIPLDAGVTVSGVAFNDVDRDPSNDWISQVASNAVRWTAPRGNELDWGTLFNFRFDANQSPSVNIAALTAHEPGAGAHLLGETLAPATQIQARFQMIGIDTWNSLDGAVYRLESTSSPEVPGSWTNTQPSVTAETATVTLVDTNAPATNRFYRAVLEQLPFSN